MRYRRTYIISQALIAMLLLVGMRTLVAQTANLDSLRLALEHSTNPDSIAEVLLKISKTYIHSAPDSALQYAQQAEPYILRSHNAHLGTRFYLHLYAINKNKTDNSGYLAIMKADSLVKLANDDELSAKVNMSIGGYHMLKSQFILGFEYLEKAYRTHERNDNKKEMARVLSVMGLLYEMQENFPKALECVEKGRNLLNVSTDSVAYAIIINNLAFYHWKLKNNTEALKMCEIELKLFQQLNHKEGIVMAHLNTAIVKGTLRRDREAEQAFREAEETIGDPYLMPKAGVKIHLDRSDYLIERKRYEEALVDLKAAVPLSYAVGDRSFRRRAYDNLAKTVTALGRYDEGYEYMRKYAAINDSIQRETSDSRLTEMEIKYETANKEKTIAELRENQQRERERWILIGLTLLAVGGLGIYAWRVKTAERYHKLEVENQALQLRMAKQAMVQVQSQLDMLKSQLNPHFLFNSLNTLSSLIPIDTKLAANFTQRFSKVYRSLLELGEETLISLKQEWSFVDSYLYLQQMRFSPNLTVSFELPELADDMMLPPLALQLLVENAIKHNIVSEASPLHIRIEVVDNELIVTNKIQLRGQARSKSTGVGLQNLSARYELLGAEKPTFGRIGEDFVARVPLIEANVVQHI